MAPAPTETDGLLSVPNGGGYDDGDDADPRRDKPPTSSSLHNVACSDNTCNPTASNWALVVVVSILTVILAVDLSLRFLGSGSGVDPNHASINSTTKSSSSPSSQSLGPHSTGRYHATQYISFTINTMGGLATHGECTDRKVDPATQTCYLGNPDIAKDTAHHLNIIGDVLHTLKNDVFREDPEVDRDPGVLKIVMLPEFFLRGPVGAYSTAELFDGGDGSGDDSEEDGLLIKLADQVRLMISDAAFEDYLFVMGTTIAAEAVDGSGRSGGDGGSRNSRSDGITGERERDAKDIMYFNFAPVYRGGMACQDSDHCHQYAILKRYISNADFLSRTTLPNPSEYDMHAYSRADRSAILRETFAKRNVTVITDNYVEIDGIKIGIEICLDHRMGSLWNNLRTRHDSELVDVQLITSAGMSIERGPNPIKPGGVVYLCDGEASSAACLRTDTGDFDPDHVCRGKPDGLQHKPHGGAGYSNFFALAGCIDMEKDHLLEGYYSMYQPQGCANTLKTYGIDVMDEFAYYPPSLEIYPTVELPRSVAA